MMRQTVAYIRRDQVVVLRNPDHIPLTYGGFVFREARWVVGTDVFRTLQGENSGVKFVEAVDRANGQMSVSNST
jgi:hypothetical protein